MMKQIHGDEHPHVRIASGNLARLSAIQLKPQVRKSHTKRSLLSARFKGFFGRKGSVMQQL
jgi:hypothetical protein